MHHFLKIFLLWKIPNIYQSVKNNIIILGALCTYLASIKATCFINYQLMAILIFLYPHNSPTLSTKLDYFEAISRHLSFQLWQLFVVVFNIDCLIALQKFKWSSTLKSKYDMTAKEWNIKGKKWALSKLKILLCEGSY